MMHITSKIFGTNSNVSYGCAPIRPKSRKDIIEVYYLSSVDESSNISPRLATDSNASTHLIIWWSR